MKQLLSILLIASGISLAMPGAAQAHDHHGSPYYRYPAGRYGAPVRYYAAPRYYGYPAGYYTAPVRYYGCEDRGYDHYRRPYYRTAPRVGFSFFFGH